MKTIPKSQYLLLKMKENYETNLKNQTIEITDEEYDNLIQYSKNPIIPIDDHTETSEEPKPIDQTEPEQEETYDYSGCDFGINQWGYNITSMEDNTVSIKYCGNKEKLTEAIIPKTVEYNNIIFNVTSIGYGAFEECINLTSITIHNSIKYIGNYAFRLCSSLTNINIPNSIIGIAKEVFWYCESLATINLSNSIEYIGDQTFFGCHFSNFINNSNLDEISNKYWGAQIVDANIDGLIIIDNSIIKYAGTKDTIIIPSNITSVSGLNYGATLSKIISYSPQIISIKTLLSNYKTTVTLYSLDELLEEYTNIYEKEIFLNKIQIFPISELPVDVLNE